MFNRLSRVFTSFPWLSRFVKQSQDFSLLFMIFLKVFCFKVFHLSFPTFFMIFLLNWFSPNIVSRFFAFKRFLRFSKILQCFKQFFIFFKYYLFFFNVVQCLSSRFFNVKNTFVQQIQLEINLFSKKRYGKMQYGLPRYYMACLRFFMAFQGISRFSQFFTGVCYVSFFLF